MKFKDSPNGKTTWLKLWKIMELTAEQPIKGN